MLRRSSSGSMNVGQTLWKVSSSSGVLTGITYVSLTGTTGGAAPNPPGVNQNIPLGTPSQVPFQVDRFLVRPFRWQFTAWHG
jgi:hypothetical protein